MQRRPHATRLLLTLWGLLLLLGGIAASALTPSDARAAKCAYRICNAETGNCFNTDIGFNCTGGGTFGICTAVGC
jgi:hypothetical protein